MRKRYKKYKVPIFTEEYWVTVYIGDPETICNAAKKDHPFVLNLNNRTLDGQRGQSYNTIPDSNPFILVKGNLSKSDGIATIAHEAVHAVEYIYRYLGIKEEIASEFIAHGTSAILRAVLADMNKKHAKKRS